jgi:hypothetical protein
MSTLRAALAAVGDALADAALDRLVTAEAALASAVAQLPVSTSAPGTPEQRARLAEEALAVRAALARCRRLGSSLGLVVHATLAAQGRVGAYDRQGGEAVQPPVHGAIGVRG